MPPQPDGIWSSPYSGEKWVTATGENRYRRGLYTFWKRTAPYASFMSFDAPSREYLRRPPSANQHAAASAHVVERPSLH